MKSDLHILYHFGVVPLRATLKYISFVMLIAFLLASLCYQVLLTKILDADIFKVTPEDVALILNYKPQNNTQIFDRDLNIISEQFSQYHKYTPYEEIPKELITSILSIEDRKFYEHEGIDFYGITRAFLSFIKNQKATQGASTITQQVVKNLLLSREKTITRKIREIVLSLYLEKIISKEKILEIYCNHIFLGNGAYGVGAAAKRYFDKDLSELKPHEMALIAGLFQSPGKYNPIKYPERALARQKVVLKAMYDYGQINKNEYVKYSQEPLEYHAYETLHGKIAPYFVDYILNESQKLLENTSYDIKDSGLKIYTTLNPKLQSLAEASIKESEDIFKKLEENIIEETSPLEQIEDKNLVEAAMLVLDRKSGEIVSMIGGKDYEKSQFNRATDALRAPGSVFKPITYALALNNGHKWNDQFYVAPVTIGNYRPRTSSHELYSETTLMEAFYQSINSTAVEVGDKLGVKRVIHFAKLLGIETELRDEAATLLGGSEVTLMDMAKVYTTFANKGKRIDPIAISKITTNDGKTIYQAPEVSQRSKHILNQNTSELIIEGLKQVVQRGTGYKARYLSPFVAGKTGTSNNSKDNWFCGFTQDLVIITWMGNDDQNGFRSHITASNTATALWARFTEKARKQLMSRRLSPPSSVEMAYVNPKYGHLDETGIPMYFRRDEMPQKKASDLLFLERGQKIRIDINEF